MSETTTHNTNEQVVIETDASVKAKRWQWNSDKRTARAEAYPETRQLILEIYTTGCPQGETVTGVLRLIKNVLEANSPFEAKLNALSAVDRRLVIRKVLADLVRENKGDVQKTKSKFRTGKRGGTDLYTW